MSNSYAERILRNRVIRIAMEGAEGNQQQTRLYGPPPHFSAKADEDFEDWVRLYERYAMAVGWSDTQKANNLMFALQGDEVRRWYSATLRETTRQLETRDQWKQALRESFAGQDVRDWAFIQLQERRQQPGETPREYVSSILQLCARTGATIKDSEKVRCLLRGLRPEMMERVAITNPKTPTEFLQHLQRLTHVGAMAQHAMAAMPTHPLPGFAAASPFVPGARNSTRDTTAFKPRGTSPPWREEPASRYVTTEMFDALQENMKALTTAVEQLSRAAPRRFPGRQSRNQMGQILCHRCGQPGHIMRQCRVPLGPPGTHGTQPSGN